MLLTWAAATQAQAAPRIRLASDQVAVAAGQAISVDVLIEDVSNLGSFQFNLLYDPDLVEVKTVQLGDFLGSTGRQPNPLGPRTDRPGDTAFGAFTLGGADQAGPDGGGRLAAVQLVGKRAGMASLRLDRTQATDPQGRPIPLAVSTPAPQPSPPPVQPTLAPTLPAANSPSLVLVAGGVAALAVVLAALALRRRQR
ncbi:MAG: hypothetical protein KIT87_19720 [Anaerolineae bacterium]|nr:hypothetical protein [Anaerolineae bacterium]